MIVYLVQHGDALPETVDPERPLSEKGETQVAKLSGFLKKLPVYPGIILHSGKLRAKQTAEALSLALGGIRLEERPFLNPNDRIEPAKSEIAAYEKTLMIVGHMPFLGRLASSLLIVREKDPLVEIAQASLLALRRTEDGYTIDCFIKNEYLK